MILRLAVAVAAVMVLAAATCHPPDPDYYPLARGLNPEQYAVLRKDWDIASRILADGLCATRLGLDPVLLRQAHRYALWLGHPKPCEDGLIAYVPDGAAVVVICPTYWQMDAAGRLTIAIHELAHIAGGTHDNTAEASRAYSRRVWDLCLVPWAQRQALPERPQQPPKVVPF